mmetsp:Transcript_24539/g.30156  ORF Transcript_24539/g.30156 Transcript_24539/m.30156 type:complete len:200 (-) Transcript_24539:11-610(-)
MASGINDSSALLVVIMVDVLLVIIAKGIEYKLERVALGSSWCCCFKANDGASLTVGGVGNNFPVVRRQPLRTTSVRNRSTAILPFTSHRFENGDDTASSNDITFDGMITLGSVPFVVSWLLSVSAVVASPGTIKEEVVAVLVESNGCDDAGTRQRIRFTKHLLVPSTNLVPRASTAWHLGDTVLLVLPPTVSLSLIFFR